MRKIILLLAAGLLSATITACGEVAEEASRIEETSIEITSEYEESRLEEVMESEESGSEEATESETLEEAGQEETIMYTEEEQETEYQVGNLDNFSVDNDLVTAFAREVKTAVADKDLEGLANLTAYPLYIGYTDGGINVQSKEEFIALGEDSIFTQELTDAIAAADENDLPASRAGFSLTDTGRPNIVFGVREGRLAVQAINL